MGEIMMTRKNEILCRYAFYFSVIFLLLLSGCASTPPQPAPEDSINYLSGGGDIKKVVDDLALPLIEKGNFTGMAVAVVTPGKDWIFTYGKKSLDTDEEIKSDTLFQIGSVSKVFASLLLMELEREGRLFPQSEVGDLIPSEMRFDSKSIRKIKLEKLASHSSGLTQDAIDPRMLWLAFRYTFTGRNIYEGLTPEDLLGYLSSTEIDPGKNYGYCYSNIGYAFLGCLLGQLDKKGYKKLLDEKVIAHMNLKDTGFSVPSGESHRLAKGYSGELPPLMLRGVPVDPWIMDGDLAAAGGLYSSPEDMVKFLKANMGLIRTDLYESMKETHKKRIEARSGKYMGLGWYTMKLPVSQKEIHYIDGLIGGYTSFAGFDPENKIGIVVLQNNCNMDDRISLTLIDRLVSASSRTRQPENNENGLRAKAE